MTRDEFIKRYHNYSTQSETAAVTEAILVNAEGIVDGHAIAVHFGNLGYGLMLMPKNGLKDPPMSQDMESTQ